MNGYDQQLKELLAQCARKKKLEASAAELRRQRDTYAARAEELKEAMREEQADVDRLEGRSLAAFFYNVVGKMDEKLTQERQEAYAARVRYDAAARELAGCGGGSGPVPGGAGAPWTAARSGTPRCSGRRPRRSRPPAARPRNRSSAWRSARPT